MVCLFKHNQTSRRPSRIGQSTFACSPDFEAVLSAGMDAVEHAHVAQSVEHLHGKEKVIGSIPIVGSIRTASVRDGHARPRTGWMTESSAAEGSPEASEVVATLS